MKIKLILPVLLLINACSMDSRVSDNAPDSVPIDIMAVADAVPRHEKRTRAGNPGHYQVLGRNYTVKKYSKGYRERGIASWYGTKFHGRKTANGEIYNMYAMTAAHKTLPIPSYVRVTHLKNKRSVVVRINDRGPFHGNRLIDLSYAAAVKLGIQKSGTGFVEVAALEPEENTRDVQVQNQEENEKLYLQVGAFSNQSNARQLQQKIEGYQLARIQMKISQMKGDTLYKVLIGPIASMGQAEKINSRLEAIGVTSSKLIRDN